MAPEEFLDRLKKINVWKRGSQRAPHKPLLLLLALGRLQQGERRLAYHNVREPLRQLLMRFGPQRRTYHPENPFWYLKNDGGGTLWEFSGEYVIGTKPSKRRRSPTDSNLRDIGAVGGFAEPVQRLLMAQPELVAQAARVILDGHFPESLHRDILDAVGIHLLEHRTRRRAARDPKFRYAVLRAYERRCAVCNYDLRVDDDLIGLEAAHIKWHAAGGPDEVANGLALCTLHHKTFDRGAIGLHGTPTQGFKLMVSNTVNGQSQAVQALVGRHGKPIRAPQRSIDRPHPEFVHWHRNEVFRGAPREFV